MTHFHKLVVALMPRIQSYTGTLFGACNSGDTHEPAVTGMAPGTRPSGREVSRELLEKITRKCANFLGVM